MLKKVISYYGDVERYIETSKITMIAFERKQEHISHCDQAQQGHGYTTRTYDVATVFIEGSTPIEFTLFPDFENKDNFVSLMNNAILDVSSDIQQMSGVKEEYTP